MEFKELRLTKAELAVIFQHLWEQRGEPSPALLEDLELSAADVAEGRRSLIERELLFVAPRRTETVLSPDLEPALSAVTRPAALGVLQETRPAGEPRSAYYSWTPAAVVVNEVTEAGDHLLRVLPGAEAVGKDVVAHSPVAEAPKPEPSAGTDPEAIVRAASLRGAFMAASGLHSAAQASEAVSWVLSEGKLWLMQSDPAVPEPVLTPASPNGLSRAIQALMDHAIDRAREGPPGSANGREDGAGPGPKGRPRARS